MDRHSKIKAEFLDEISQVIFLDKEGLILESDHHLVELSHYAHKPVSEVFPALDIIQALENASLNHPVAFPIVHEIAGHKGPFQVLGRKIKKAGRKAAVLILQKMPQEKSYKVQANNEVFITSISHKLRTPMNTILGFTELLKDSSLSEDQLAYANFIHAAGENLLNLISDVVDYIKIDTGHYEVREVDFKLKETIEDIIGACKSKAAEKQIRFYDIISPQLPELARGDQKILTYVLQSLVTRAIQSTDSGFVEVVIKARNSKKGQLIVEILVVDSGEALGGENVHTQQLMPFTDLESTGLELALTGKLIKLNDGKINISGNNTNGNQYTVHLNFGPSKSTFENDTHRDDDSLWNTSFQDLKILLAEDIHVNQILTEKILMKYGCNLEIAGDGRKVIEKLQEKSYDLILMDLQMPEMDGYETTEYIRTKMPGAVKSIPIIALTAHVINGEKEKCLKSGMNDYLAKPFSSSQLCTKINGLFSKQHQISAGQIQSAIAMNVDFLRKTFRGNPSFLAKIIESSLQDIPDHMSNLYLSVTKKDYPTIVEIITKLKSVFRLLGLYELAGLAYSIEKKALSNLESQIATIDRDIDHLEYWIPDITNQLMIELRKIESYN